MFVFSNRGKAIDVSGIHVVSVYATGLIIVMIMCVTANVAFSFFCSHDNSYIFVGYMTVVVSV